MKLKTLLAAAFALTSVASLAFNTTLKGQGVDCTTPQTIAPGDSATVLNRCEGVSAQTFEFGVSASKPTSGWSVRLTPYNREESPIDITVKLTYKNYGDFDQVEQLEITAMRADTLLFCNYGSKDISSNKEPNYLRIDLYDDLTIIGCGGRNITNNFRIAPLGFFESATVTGKKKIELVRYVSSFVEAPDIKPSEYYSAERIAELPESSSNIAGVWELFDSSIDTDYAAHGGRYRIAIVPTESGPATYEIIYLGGATTNKSKWQPGMKKGSLTMTPFVNNYNLDWIDSMGEHVDAEAYCTLENNLLVLEFPLLNTRLRFTKPLK